LKPEPDRRPRRRDWIARIEVGVVRALETPAGLFVATENRSRESQPIEVRPVERRRTIGREEQFDRPGEVAPLVRVAPFFDCPGPPVSRAHPAFAALHGSSQFPDLSSYSRHGWPEILLLATRVPRPRPAGISRQMDVGYPSGNWPALP
jgi:hypothetical protein